MYKNKVALITGGASGIGYELAIALLKKGAKGVTLADIDAKAGEEARDEINKEFGIDKAIFVPTDVSKLEEFKNAFEKTVDVFKNVDILINNAGILGDSMWQREIEVNVVGVIHGMILGIDHYLPKYKQDSEAIILNVSCITAINTPKYFPIYCGTKAAVIAMTRSWGLPHHYHRSNVRVIAICPGDTTTCLFDDLKNKTLGDDYSSVKEEEDKWKTILEETWGHESLRQHPKHVAQEAIEVMQRGNSGSIWTIQGGGEAIEYFFEQ